MSIFNFYRACGRTIESCAAPVLALSLAGCAAAPPTPELVEARNSYESAKAGPAADLAPARLEEARQALATAEEAFLDDRKSDRAKFTAYIATHRAEIATIRGREKGYKQDLKRLKEEYDELEKKSLTMTKEELRTAREGLEKSQAELQAAQSRLAAAVASLKEMAQVKEEARGVVITLSGSVLFSTGKSQLLPIAKEKLNDVAKALSDQGYKSILVEGHTDSQGSESDNESLSLKRAEAVADHLISQGIERAKVQAKGLGESRPVAPNDTPEGRANNRRVEIVVD